MNKGKKATRLESMIWTGDSGGGSFVERDGEKYLIGIHSWSSQYIKWDAVNSDVWVGGQGVRDWVQANMNSETPVSSFDFKCDKWPTIEHFGPWIYEPAREFNYLDCDCVCERYDKRCQKKCKKCIAESYADANFL